MITSTSNAKIKNVINLRKNARARRQAECFLVEGPRMFFETPPERLIEVYMTEDFCNRHEDRLQGISYEIVSENVCRHISDTKTPQGVVAVVRRKEISLKELLQMEEHPLLFVLEDLQDPGNLGTILRTAEGAGVTGIIMNRGTVDPYNSKVIRSTMGAVFRMPFVTVPDLEEVFPILRENGIRSYAAHLEGGLFYGEDYTGGTAFLIGNEGNGLKETTASRADARIRIPMKGQVESLNAAIASTVLMYEAMRQRDFA